MTEPIQPNDPASKAIRGDFLVPNLSSPRMVLAQDYILEVNPSGRIIRFRRSRSEDVMPTTISGAVWTPGWIDTHIHFPQLDIRGSASGPLLPWLEETVFPEEAKFRSAPHAQNGADRFVNSLLEVGTTTASVYGASDAFSTDILFSTFARRGLRGLIGLTLMDKDCPPTLEVPVDDAMAAARNLSGRWHGFDNGRLQFVVTPRFALSCTPRMMLESARLADQLGCLIQTHMSENPSEVEAVSAAFPSAVDYLDVYEKHQLAGSRTLFAHCIWLDDAMWDRMRLLGCSVSHCPDSNFFLGSGQMDIDAALSRKIPIGLGSDVGAGRSFDMRRAMSSAFDTARVRGSSISPDALVWLASRGGALALGLGDELGSFYPGHWADLVAWRLPSSTQGHLNRICEVLAFCHDVGRIECIYVGGRLLRKQRHSSAGGLAPEV